MFEVSFWVRPIVFLARDPGGKLYLLQLKRAAAGLDAALNTNNSTAYMAAHIAQQWCSRVNSSSGNGVAQGKSVEHSGRSITKEALASIERSARCQKSQQRQAYISSHA